MFNNVHGTLPADIFIVGVRLTDQSYPRLPQNKLSLSDLIRAIILYINS